MTTDNLKPCPCCGSNDVFTADLSIYCGRCGLQTSKHKTIYHAALYWNKRTHNYADVIRCAADICFDHQSRAGRSGIKILNDYADELDARHAKQEPKQ